MKQFVKKIGRFLLWALPALLAIYVMAKLADYCWYRVQIPIGFHDANWTGKWDTEQYLGTTGRLLVRMPDPLPEDEDFKAEALVYYPIYCPWQTGSFVKMDFVGHFNPDNPATAGKSTNRIPGGRWRQDEVQGHAGRSGRGLRGDHRRQPHTDCGQLSLAGPL